MALRAGATSIGKGFFYPQKMKPANYLTFYAQHFSIAEINTRLYRLPNKETVLKWGEAVPKGFRFWPKMSRYLTHMKKLNDPEDSLERFFDVFKPMGSVIGPILMQLPYMVSFRYDAAETLFTLLRKKYRTYAFVLEPRKLKAFTKA